MPSPLSFASTEDFRKKLLVKNLFPYNEEGFTASSSPGTSEFAVKEFTVIDSADVEVIGDKEEVKLYVTNKYGPANVNGYGNPIQIDTKVAGSNNGEFTGTQTQKDLENEQFMENAFLKNRFGPPDGFDTFYYVTDVQNAIQSRDTYYKFVSSYYTPASILFSKNPIGSDGTVSQDSVMIQIAAKSLKDELQYRVDEEIRQETIGRANFLSALQDPFIAADIIRGSQELIEPNWNISVPGNPVGKGLDFISRITGVYTPFSWIPGDYFAVDQKTSFVNQAFNFAANLFGAPDIVPEKKSGSDIFLNSTGRGQSSALFKSLTYNNFRPDYKANFIGDLNLSAPNGNYYIGKRTQDPNDIIFPNNELPINEHGRRVQVAVRGYGELGKIYEGERNKFKFGLDAPNNDDNPGLQGGFTWVSPKSRPAAGLTVGKGGQVVGSDNGFNALASQYNASESLNYKLTEGSILDETQRLINAADGLKGDARLSHVGNAINQVSKVFNDGTREITKGSRVKRYVNEGGAEVGKEYCRVFTKDTPYYTMADLQKSEGNIRKMTYSVLDNTYNLNIAPIKGDTSTNIVDGQVKKYMLSLENLSWRTSTMQQDLPPCEKGPSGGRIMWFPPYDLRVDESVSVRWNTNEFLGRPEPIYTYNNTQRQGSLSFKIIVDHPSVLNTLVDKELANVTPDSEVTKIVDSFFAGCKTLDIYELAKKYGQLSYNDIFEIVTKTSNPETYRQAVESLPPRETPPDAEVISTDVKEDPTLTEFNGLDLYFDNDIPGDNPNDTTSTLYYTTYDAYLAKKTEYIAQAATINQSEQVTNMFDKITESKNRLSELIDRIVEVAESGYRVAIELVGSASAPNNEEYNNHLSSRRIDSVKKQILQDDRIKALNSPSFIITVNPDAALGELTTSEFGSCTEELTGTAKIYSTQAMGCRRTQVKSIGVVKLNPTGTPPPDDYKEIEGTVYQGSSGQTETPVKQTPVTTTEERLREGVTKKILRKLLSECDYFEAMSDDTSFLYEGIKEKIKYFSPTFHAITPEGLNSRLTFLHQCLRPGNTIPTIGPDGKPLDVDAQNTSFGAPPICILRVGDFYHTKIAINQMSIRYEPLHLDLNPEGIGVQPMLADVSLSFYFIGGHGLKEPVAQLQNALSFNYYANTEMYDERAVETEDTSTIDLEVIEEVYGEIPFSVNDISNEKNTDGGSTIGEIESKNITNSGTSVTGVIKYKTIMDELIVNTAAYNQTLNKTLQDVNTDFGQSGLMMFTKDRGYVDGYMTTGQTSTKLFGKSEKLQNKIDNLFKEALSDVDNDSSPFLFILKDDRSLKNKDMRKYKKFVKELIENKKNEFSSRMSSLQNDLIQNEQNLIRVIDKLNVVDSLTDGFIKPNGTPTIYELTATTEVYDSAEYSDTLLELEGDMNKVSTDLNDVITELTNNNIITENYNSSFSNFNSYNTTINTSADIRFYTIFVTDLTVTSKKNSFTEVLKKFVTDNGFDNAQSWKNDIDKNFTTINVDYDKMFKAVNEQFKKNSDSTIQQKFKTYEPYPKGKIRKFTFANNVNASASQKKLLKNLYSGLNEGERNKWNEKVKLD